MIITVTPNPALDLTYTVPRLTPGEVHAVECVHQRAGGKGVNVAAVAMLMGHASRAVAPTHEVDGQWLADDLASRGIPLDAVTWPGRLRRSVAVVASACGATVFNEPGDHLPPEAWQCLVAGLGRALDQAAPATIVVASGSLPPGAPRTGYSDLVAVARARGAPIIVDAKGPALVGALPAQPDLVKPNRSEAAEVTGRAAIEDSAQALLDNGIGAVVISDGAAGLLAATPSGRARVVLDAALPGNPTGAGDALAAGLASVLRAASRPWPLDTLVEAAREGCAWGAAAVLAPVAGLVDPRDVDRLRHRVRVD